MVEQFHPLLTEVLSRLRASGPGRAEGGPGRLAEVLGNLVRFSEKGTGMPLRVTWVLGWRPGLGSPGLGPRRWVQGLEVFAPGMLISQLGTSQAYLRQEAESHRPGHSSPGGGSLNSSPFSRASRFRWFHSRHRFAISWRPFSNPSWCPCSRPWFRYLSLWGSRNLSLK